MTNLFQNIQEKNIEKLKRILKANTITYRKNVNILSNVNRDDFIAIVDTGSVQLCMNDYEGNSTLIEEVQEGEIFSSLSFSVYSEEAIAITKEETQITYIEYNQITNNEIVKNDYYIFFIKNLIKLLSDQVKMKNDRIEILTKKTIRDKLLEYLKKEAQKQKSKIFFLPMSYTELANYLSIDRSAMTRELNYLKTEGFIKTTGRRITLLY